MIGFGAGAVRHCIDHVGKLDWPDRSPIENAIGHKKLLFREFNVGSSFSGSRQKAISACSIDELR